MKEYERVKPTSIGGQAVIEGVMMRGKKMYAVAVRKADEEIVIDKQDVHSITERHAFLKWPVLRGVVSFVESLVMGTKIIMYSAGLVDLEEEEPSRFEKFLQDKLGEKLNDVIVYFSVFLSVIMGVGLFMLLPVFISSFFNNILPGTWMLGVVEGLVRIALFLCYIVLISQMKDIKRVFQYHGAEHKTINCYESGQPLTVENVQNHTRLHKRCGTSFLLIVMLISMVVFFFIRTDVIYMRFLSRIALVPVIAGLSYEVIKWAGRSDSKVVGIISYPGLLLQKLTTKEPDAAQIEVAIASMTAVLEVEGD